MITKKELLFSGRRMGRSLLFHSLYDGVCPKCSNDLIISEWDESNVVFKCPVCNIAFITKKQEWMNIPEKSDEFIDIHEVFEKIREVDYDEPTRIYEIMKDDPGFKAFFQKYDNIIKGRLKKEDIQLIQTLDKREEVFEPMEYPLWEDFTKHFNKLEEENK